MHILKHWMPSTIRHEKEKLIELLKAKSIHELIEELVTLSENLTIVQDYFDLKYHGKTKSAILEKYKRKIADAINPDWEFNNGLDIGLVAEIIEGFLNVTPKINYQIDLELYALEEGNRCANDLGGDFGEDYYVYFEELFEQTLNKCRKVKVAQGIIDHINSILETAFGGYGHKDTLEDLWAEYK